MYVTVHLPRTASAGFMSECIEAKRSCASGARARPRRWVYLATSLARWNHATRTSSDHDAGTPAAVTGTSPLVAAAAIVAVDAADALPVELARRDGGLDAVGVTSTTTFMGTLAGGSDLTVGASSGGSAVMPMMRPI